MVKQRVPLFEAGPGRDALKAKCRAEKIPIAALDQLVEAELDQVGKLRKRGLHERFDEILDGVSGHPSDDES